MSCLNSPEELSIPLGVPAFLAEIQSSLIAPKLLSCFFALWFLTYSHHCVDGLWVPWLWRVNLLIMLQSLLWVLRHFLQHLLMQARVWQMIGLLAILNMIYYCVFLWVCDQIFLSPIHFCLLTFITQYTRVKKYKFRTDLSL